MPCSWPASADRKVGARGRQPAREQRRPRLGPSQRGEDGVGRAVVIWARGPRPALVQPPAVTISARRNTQIQTPKAFGDTLAVVRATTSLPQGADPAPRLRCGAPGARPRRGVWHAMGDADPGALSGCATARTSACARGAVDGRAAKRTLLEALERPRARLFTERLDPPRIRWRGQSVCVCVCSAFASHRGGGGDARLEGYQAWM